MLKGIDQRPASFSLNFDSHYDYKTNLGGLLSLIYFILLTLIFIFKSIDLFQRNHVYFTTKTLKHDDILYLDISSGDFRLELYKANAYYY